MIENNKIYIDINDALPRVRHNASFYRKLLESFLDNTGEKQLVDAINSNNFNNATKTAHAIKGISANLSLIELNKMMLFIEKKLNSEANILDKVPLIQECFKETNKAINNYITSL